MEKKQILYDFTRIWNLKKKKNEQTKQKLTEKRSAISRGKRGWGGQIGERANCVATNGSQTCAAGRSAASTGMNENAVHLKLT